MNKNFCFIYNFQVFTEDILPNEEGWGSVVSVQNRAFQYGDGVFETMIWKNGEIQFLNDHLERLSGGLKILQINCPIDKAYLQKSVPELLFQNNILQNDESQARIRLQVWRKSGGLYTPENNNGEFYLSVQPFSPPALLEKKKVLFFDDVQLAFSLFSPFKTCNSLPYILAGLAKKQAQADDMILSDRYGNISECSSSNLFWVKGNSLFTPGIESGCVDGIMRKQILKKAIELGVNVEVGLFKKEQLLAAEYVFSTNVTGIYTIRQVENTIFKEIRNDFVWLTM